jgi:hypothetical protein
MHVTYGCDLFCYTHVQINTELNNETEKNVIGYYWLIGLACKTQNDRKEKKKQNH